MTGNRLNFLDQHMARSRYTETPLSPLFERLHRRMKAKLNAFLLPPRQTLRKYPPADKSVAARYARAIAYYLIPELDKALAEINWLIAHERGNPYFHELKGQMLFENGKIAASIAPYQAAVDLNPKSALLRLGLGMALIESKDPSALPVVISNLRVAVAVEPRMSQAWRQLAIGYGRTGQMAKSFLALAEEAILHRRFKDALNHGEKAKRLIKPGTPDWLAAGDVIAAANAGNKKRH
jgi:predicted Zn-dependent protease